MAVVISVQPSADRWILSSRALDLDLSFESGAQAERAGRHLLNELLGEGHAAELHIYLKDGRQAGRFVGGPRALAPAA